MSGWRYALSDVRLGEEAIAASLEALRSNWLTMGPRTQQLERAWAERFAAAEGVAVSSGSAALHLACRAAGIGPGDEVIVPATSFVASAHAPHWCGAETVLADVASVRAPLAGADAVAARIGERTKAVLAVHMFGFPVELADVAALCEERGLILIEDCCEAAGAVAADGTPIGSQGVAAAFSFFSKSPTPVGEGGIVVTGDEEIAESVRLSRSHAMTSVTWDRHRGHAETYDVVDLGFNYRIDEPRAALARAELDRLDEAVQGLRAVERAYRAELEEVEGAEPLFDADHAARASHYALPVLLPDHATRERVRAELVERGIQTSFYPSISQLTLYEAAAERHPCPNAERFADRHLTLPLWRSLTPEQVGEICAELGVAIARVG